MKVAIVYNRDSRRVINLFGLPNQEKIGLKTIDRITAGLKSGGHQVRTIEGDKDLVNNLEYFMPRVVKGELPGLVFNLSYGIQGQARYTHVPGILEMVGIPYVGSGPLAHSLALDKVVAKMIFQQQGIPTPRFTVLDSPDSNPPDIPFPLIVKPKNEAVSLGLRIVNNEKELHEGAAVIFEKYHQQVLVEQYIEGREINVGLLGNNPPETLPPVELLFGDTGPAIYTLEDKTRKSDREISWQCPPKMPESILDTARDTARKAFSALGCNDCARVDMRLDNAGNLYVLEVNSLPSLGEHGSYTIAAARAGLDFNALVCRLVDIASARYFGTPNPPGIGRLKKSTSDKVFSYLVERRDEVEKRVQEWAQLSSRTSDPIGILEARRKLKSFCEEMGMTEVPELSDERSVRTWQTKTGLNKGLLLIGHLDVPLETQVPSVVFRRDPEWLYGEGIASSRAPLVCMQYALRALRSQRLLRHIPLGLLYYFDEGRDCRYSHTIIQKTASLAENVLILRPGNLENNVVTQRRGWRNYRLTVTGDSHRLGKIYRNHGVLRWTTSCLDEFSAMTSKEERIAVSTGELKTVAYPQLLPHRTISTILLSFLDLQKADTIEKKMKSQIKNKDFKVSLELISERPPMKKNKKSTSLYRRLKEVADRWEIPLNSESSLYPSVAGLTPASRAVICGIGPIGRDVDTPQEAVLRLSLMQRTLLLAMFLSSRYGNI